MRRLLFLMVALVLGSLAKADIVSRKSHPAKTDEPAARSINQFAFEYLAKNPAGNVFFSPYSIETALAMTAVGAKKETASQMRKVLHLSNSSNDDFEKLMGALKGIKDYELQVANRLWGSKGEQYSAQFLHTLKANYDSDLKPMDFKTQAEAARVEINTWVEKITNDKIKDLLAPGTINSVTELVITNAIYFKGKWQRPFAKSATHEGDFKSPAKLEKVSFMHNQKPYLYHEDGTLQILEMPYLGDDIAMDVILPKEGLALAALEKTLSLPRLESLIKALSVFETNVQIPKFKAEITAELSKDLAAMGMPDAFDKHKANFSGVRELKGDENLFISAVVHKAFVDVDEEGTEAAAATAVVMARTASVMLPQKPKKFHADRPFLYLIRHKKSGAILFIGRYEHP